MAPALSEQRAAVRLWLCCDLCRRGGGCTDGACVSLRTRVWAVSFTVSYRAVICGGRGRCVRAVVECNERQAAELAVLAWQACVAACAEPDVLLVAAATAGVCCNPVCARRHVAACSAVPCVSACRAPTSSWPCARTGVAWIFTKHRVLYQMPLRPAVWCGPARC